MDSAFLFPYATCPSDRRGDTGVHVLEKERKSEHAKEKAFDNDLAYCPDYFFLNGQMVMHTVAEGHRGAGDDAEAVNHQQTVPQRPRTGY